jgi:hypothetical protein
MKGSDGTAFPASLPHVLAYPNRGGTQRTNVLVDRFGDALRSGCILSTNEFNDVEQIFGRGG